MNNLFNRFITNKKLLISILVLVVLLTVIILILSRNFHNNTAQVIKPQITDIVNKVTVESQVGLMVSEMLKNSSGTQSKGKNSDLVRVMPLTSNQCMILNGADKDKCLESVKYNEIFSNSSSTLESCYSLTGTFREACISNYAKNDKDWSKCELLANDVVINECISANAINNPTSGACEYFKNKPDEYLECTDRVKAVHQGSFTDSKKQGDIQKCKEIRTLEYFNQCIMRSSGKCEDLNDQVLTDKCNSVKFFSTVIDTGEAKNCAVIPVESTRKVCEMYFSDGKIFKDSDGDGVTNNKEVWFNTDPFKAGEEEKKLVIKNEIYKLTNVSIEDIIYKIKQSTSSAQSKIDSDNDGLVDEDEFNIYKTDPHKTDTDGDGYQDGIEVKAGYNPNGPGKLIK